MSGIRVCAIDQGRFFISKNPEQAPIFEVLRSLRDLSKNILKQGVGKSKSCSLGGGGGGGGRGF